MCPVLIEQENGPDKDIDDLRQDIFNSMQGELVGTFSKPI